jgi:diacylglycerol kinase (ATP)
MKPDEIGPVERLVNATRYSLSGLSAAWRTQAALRYEFLALLIVGPVAWLLGRGVVERALLIGSCFLVIVVELINSAIESAVDRIGRERHELSARAKDLGSAAVFCSILLAAGVWIIILLTPA